jgi:hypothetical protein
MQVYRRFKNRNFRDLTIDVSALYLITERSTPEPVANDALRRAENGEAVTHADPRALVQRWPPMHE